MAMIVMVAVVVVLEVNLGWAVAELMMMIGRGKCRG